ncbi:hypothetical protein ACH4TP_38165 [Streptomyces sp. NPDC021012]|uniref:hypothetical protein n=1 Tax=Streptomyces sp. NPDC021012 TaxID=3365107 RepID=UPI0037A47B5E
MHVIDENVIWPSLGRNGTTVRARVLSDDGATAQIQIEDCGVHARQGQVHQVPSDAVRYRH